MRPVRRQILIADTHGFLGEQRDYIRIMRARSRGFNVPGGAAAQGRGQIPPLALPNWHPI